MACGIAYNGSHYHGWQSQPHLDVATIQETLEAALSQVASGPLRVHCAGRTDTGVHATGQVVHFDPPVQRSPKAWVLGTNANLPHDVRVLWALPVAADFHARFSARSRRYRYIVSNSSVRPAHLGGQISWYRYPLDSELMQREAQHLLGEQDFSAFRAAACQSTTPFRNIRSLSVERRGELVVIDICANAFLHHMVRNIAGSLLAVGSGRQPEGWLAGLLAGRDRTLAADTAAPDGLYLIDVSYPPAFDLPEMTAGPFWLST